LKQHGLVYDAVVCNDEVLIGKPEPLMTYKIINRLNVPTTKCIKVGESYLNVLEGKNAKIDTINILDSSNDMGMDEQIFDDSCEIIKNCKRINVINNLMNYPMPKYFVPSILDIGNLLKNKLS